MVYLLRTIAVLVVLVSLSVGFVVGWVTLLMWPFAEQYFYETGPYILSMVLLPVVQITVCALVVQGPWKIRPSKDVVVAAVAAVFALASVAVWHAAHHARFT